jgi:GNAT superfamily N-acetyltransferase
MTDKEEVSLRRFDVADPEDRMQIARLYRHFLVEQMSAGLSLAGAPLAPYLRTLLIVTTGKESAVGFVTVQIHPPAVELMYLDRTYRGCGIGRAALQELRDACPEQLILKGPLSPAGQALAHRTGLPVVGGGESAYAEQLQEAISLLAQYCRHKRGRPDRACKRCITSWAHRASTLIVSEQVQQGMLTHAVSSLLEGEKVL